MRLKVLLSNKHECLSLLFGRGLIERLDVTLFSREQQKFYFFRLPFSVCTRRSVLVVKV